MGDRLSRRLLLVVLTLSFVVSAASAITFRSPWDGPLVFHSTGWSSGTIWLDAAGGPLSAGTYDDPYDPGLGLTRVAGPGSWNGEDSWGLLRVDSILKGMVVGNKIVADPSGDNLWVHGDNNQELIAMYYGARDTALEVTPSGSQVTESVGLTFDLYLQDKGTFFGAFNGAMDGSAGRVDLNKYRGVGYDAAGNPLANSSLWLSGHGQAGFLGPVDEPFTELVSVFNPAVAVDALAGSAKTYVSLEETDSGVGSANAKYDSNFFVNAAGDAWADVSLIYNTKMNNPTNTPGGYDWTVTISDDITMIPEPTLALLMLCAIPALRRRRH